MGVALNDPTVEVVNFIHPPKSFLSVIEEFQTRGEYLDFLKAQIYIFDALMELSEADYSASHVQWEAVVDVYGVVRDRIPWYVKFCIYSDEITGERKLEEISFHRIEKDLRLANRRTIKMDGTII